MRSVWRYSIPIAALLLVWAGQPAGAVAIYTYTGSPFELFSLGSPYTGSDHVTATLTLDSSLPASSSMLDATALPGFGLAMSDGQQTLTETTPGLVNIAATMSTDATGAVVGWAVSLFGGFNQEAITTRHNLTGFEPFLDIGRLESGHFGQVNAKPGTWVCSGTCAAVPEPAAWLLVVTGIAALAGVRRRAYVELEPDGRSSANSHRCRQKLRQVSVDLLPVCRIDT